VLRPSNRYAHTPDYLQRLAAATGFTVLASQAIEARQENGAPIGGHALLLCK
jgi:predicted TPR repeat methyltransferase